MNISIKSQAQQTTNAYDDINELQLILKKPHYSLSLQVRNKVIKSGRKDNIEINLPKHLKKKGFEKESEPKQNKFCKK